MRMTLTIDTDVNTVSTATDMMAAFVKSAIPAPTEMVSAPNVYLLAEVIKAITVQQIDKTAESRQAVETALRQLPDLDSLPRTVRLAWTRRNCGEYVEAISALADAITELSKPSA